jgi:hypothetical protein
MTDINDGRAAHLDGLRRIAFGRAHTPEEQAAAAAAHEALARAEAEDSAAAAEAEAAEAEAAEAEAAERAAVESAHAETAPDIEPDDDLEPASGEQPARWRVWIAPALIALMVGALAGGALTAVAGGSADATPTPAPTFTPGSSGRPAAAIPVTTSSSFVSGPGDLQAAERWFAGEQREEDKTTLFQDSQTGIVAESTRLVESTPHGDVWVAQSSSGGLCLIVGSDDGSAGATCATAGEFVAKGLTLGQSNLNVAWDGARLASMSTKP